MKAFLLTLVCLIVLSIPMLAQEFIPGRVITITGDTLTGLLKNSRTKQLLTGCVFRATAESPTTKYSPSQLQGFDISNRRYRSYQLPSGQSTFLLVLAAGKLTLLSDGDRHFWVQSATSSALLPLIERDVQFRGTRVVELLPFRYQLDSLFRDCPDLAIASQRVTYQLQSLADAVNRYNACQGQVTYRHTYLRSTTQFGVKAMGAIATCFYPKYNKDEQTNGTAFGAGLFLRTTNENFSRGRMSLQLELQAVGFNFAEIDYKPFYLMTPVTLQYALRPPKQSHWYPYLEAGFQLNFRLNEHTAPLLQEPKNAMSFVLPIGGLGVLIKSGASLQPKYGLSFRYTEFTNTLSNRIRSVNLNVQFLF